MKKINKKYSLGIFLGLISGKKVLAEFQQATSKNEADLPAADFLNNILHYTSVGLAIVFIISLALFISSGIYFITAGGDENVLEDAHGLWRVAALGLVIALIGYITINLIKYFI